MGHGAWLPRSQSDQCCYPVCQGPAVSKGGLCGEKPPVLEKSTPWNTSIFPRAHQGLPASAPTSPPCVHGHSLCQSLPHSSVQRGLVLLASPKVPDLLNLLTPRNLLLPLRTSEDKEEGLSKPFVESTRPLKEERKSTQPSLPLEWSCAKSGVFQIRHRRCFDSKAVSVDYSTGTSCCPGHHRGTSSSPALGAAAGDSSVSQTSPTHMQAALFGFFTPLPRKT